MYSAFFPVMLTAEFDYVLPVDRVAQTPPAERGTSRLMVLDRSAGSVGHRQFKDFAGLLLPGDLLVLNDTAVLKARLDAASAVKPGRRVEILLLEPAGGLRWTCLAGPGRNARVGEELIFGSGAGRARVVSTTDFGGRVLEFDPGTDPDRLMREHGRMPLPPYLRKNGRAAPAGRALASRAKPGGSPKERDDAMDEVRYQTVFAREPGAVAAPTAALHFTSEILDDIRKQGVEVCSVTLHVGLGTFRPVKSDRVEDHVMHGEKFRVPAGTAEAVQRARADGRRIVAVGTTTVRVLETFFGDPSLEAGCWHRTRMFIVPGFRFRVVGALLTNFHLPRSTLLMLVSAFAGREFLMRAYEEAIREQYKFYSYGDAMFVQ